MASHVKLVGWLWIVNGLIGIVMVTIGLVIANMNIAAARDAMIATTGALCLFLPGVLADFVAGYGVLKLKRWGRILAIILGIVNLIFFPIGTALGVYTLWTMFHREAKTLFGVVE